MLKISGSILVVVLALLVAALAMTRTFERDKPHLARTADERRAVRSAAAYVFSRPAYREAAGRTPGVSDEWGYWLVSFPPNGSVTGFSGPTVVVDRQTFKVTSDRGELEAVLVPNGWPPQSR